LETKILNNTKELCKDSFEKNNIGYIKFQDKIKKHNSFGILNLEMLQKSLKNGKNGEIEIIKIDNKIVKYLIYRNMYYQIMKYLEFKGKYILCCYGTEIIFFPNRKLASVITSLKGKQIDNFSFNLPKSSIKPFLKNFKINDNVVYYYEKRRSETELEEEFKDKKLKTDLSESINYEQHMINFWPKSKLKRKTPIFIGLFDITNYIMTEGAIFLLRNSKTLSRRPTDKVHRNLHKTKWWKGDYAFCSFVTKDDPEFPLSDLDEYNFSVIDINFIRNENFLNLINELSGIQIDDYSFNLSENKIKTFLNHFNLNNGEIFLKKKVKSNFLQQQNFNILFCFKEFHHKYEFEILIENIDEPLNSLLSISDLKNDYINKQEIINTISKVFNIFPNEFNFNCTHSFIELQKEKILISKNDLSLFFKNAAFIESNNIKFRLPKEFKNLIKPKLSLRFLSQSDTENISYLSLADILDFKWELALGKKVISKDEFEKLVQSGKKLIKHMNDYLFINPIEATQLIIKMQNNPHFMSSIQILHSIFTKEYCGIPVKIDKSFEQIANNLTSSINVSIPYSLQAKLRPYQIKGFEWMYSNAMNGFGCCIADDMGLGKTIQVIAFILKLKEDKLLSKSSLVICPTTLIENWRKEINKFSPSLNVQIYHGQNRKQLNPSILINKDVIITSYGTIRQEIEKLCKLKFSTIVIDEAQNIKNYNTAQTKAIKLLNSKYRIAMSGTPVENRLLELWSIFDFIIPEYLGSQYKFKREFANPIEQNLDLNKIKKLKKMTSPFLIRRLKTDRKIIPDLPDKIIVNEYCNLTKEQTAIYEATVQNTLSLIQSKVGIVRRGLVLNTLNSLKQICNHPVQYKKSGFPQKEHSGKMLRTIDIIKQVVDCNEKVLIFSQYTVMLEIVRKIIESELYFSPLLFTGALSREKRDQLINKFKSDVNAPVMLISLKAGGTGLNLVNANNVIHYDLWWNPSVENQATDRTYRIGQKKNVVVHRLISNSTFEEKIDEMLIKKQNLSDLTLPTLEKKITEFTDEELKDIFTLTDS